MGSDFPSCYRLVAVFISGQPNLFLLLLVDNENNLSIYSRSNCGDQEENHEFHYRNVSLSCCLAIFFFWGGGDPLDNAGITVTQHQKETKRDERVITELFLRKITFDG